MTRAQRIAALSLIAAAMTGAAALLWLGLILPGLARLAGG